MEHGGRDIEVWMGWNPNMKRFFMLLCNQGDDPFYSNLEDPGTKGGASLGYYVDKARLHGIDLPIPLIERVASDACLNVENDRSGFEKDGTEFSNGPRPPARPGDPRFDHTVLRALASEWFADLAARLEDPETACAAVKRTYGACLLGQTALSWLSETARRAPADFDLCAFIQLVLLDAIEYVPTTLHSYRGDGG